MELPHPLPARIALRGLARQIPFNNRCRDLVEVATAILLADRLTLRGRGGLGRRIHLCPRVRCPEIWERAVPHLREALLILGDDDFSFDFHSSPSGASAFPLLQPRQERVQETSDKAVDRVVLFSGGLDSASAAAAFAKRGVRATYVTHYVTGIRRVAKLLGDIGSAFAGKTDLPHVQVHVAPMGPLVPHMRENSRRTRSFLFASLALAAAVGVKANKVYICENGPLAINLPLHPAMIPTRHAHSRFLAAMGGLGEELFQRPIRFMNPFELTTKGMMSRVFLPHPELALQTVSCWNQQWAGRGPQYGKGHCGHCIPCLIRLVSLESAGIDIPSSHFDCDVRRLARKPKWSAEELRRLAAYRSIREFARRIESLRSWRDFLVSYPAVLETSPTSKPLPPEEWYKRVFRMMKKFAREIRVSLEGGIINS